MAILSTVVQTARKITQRTAPRVLIVKDAWRLTPSMFRVVFAGPSLAGFP